MRCPSSVRDVLAQYGSVRLRNSLDQVFGYVFMNSVQDYDLLSGEGRL